MCFAVAPNEFCSAGQRAKKLATEKNVKTKSGWAYFMGKEAIGCWLCDV